jgi:MSHA pilin protein MshD
MNGLSQQRPSERHARRGLTLAEAVVSMLIVSVMLVAALNTVGASRMTQKKTAERSRGFLLAENLMSEVLQQAYEDPDLAPGSIGLEGAEVGDGSRELWDDVDDYDGWSASPPQQKDGSEFGELKEWTRSVEVRWVDPTASLNVSGTDTGVKRVVVTVTDGDAVVFSLVAVRTDALRFVQEFD